jgi:hypothetical protein
MTSTVRMESYGGTDYGVPVMVDIEAIAPGVGRMTCLECHGDPDAYAAAFGRWRRDLAPDGCVDCKNRGWVYVGV